MPRLKYRYTCQPLFVWRAKVNNTCPKKAYNVPHYDLYSLFPGRAATDTPIYATYPAYLAIDDFMNTLLMISIWDTSSITLGVSCQCIC